MKRRRRPTEASKRSQTTNHTNDTNERRRSPMELIYKEGYAIVGACFEIYNELGAGFLEPVYQECLELELALRNIPFCRQVELQLSYKGKTLKQIYRSDFVCFEKIMLEIKAASDLADAH